MKLTKKDKEILKSMGYLDWDIQQIEAASNYTSYKVSETDKTIEEYLNKGYCLVNTVQLIGSVLLIFEK